ncbi:MAG TPA: hypothetical protein VIL56_04870 [Gaiellaceae bacterium]|jgi:hypothetical protein
MTRTRRAAAILVAVAAISCVFAGTAFAAYWFFQGNLSGTTLKDRDSTGTQYGRQSFDNTNHPTHVQYVVFVPSSGSWDTVGQACPSGQSGCDSGPIGVDGSAYPHGGCENPSS